MSVCDFCKNPDPEWEYPCQDFLMFVLNNQEHWSDGAWEACDKCSELIETSEYVGLARRAMRELKDENFGVIILLHGGFLAHRTGKRRRIKTRG